MCNSNKKMFIIVLMLLCFLFTESTVTAETAPGDYTVTYGMEGDTYVITNARNVDTVSVSVSKIWDDDGNRDGLRPGSVRYALVTDRKQGEPVLVSPGEDGKFSYAWNDLLKYHDGGILYEYSVAELDIPQGYEASYSSEQTDEGIRYTVVNRHPIELITVNPHIYWDDDNDRDGIRPGHLTMRIIADDASTDITYVVGPEDGWTHPFELPRYRNGQIVSYAFEVIETVHGYTYRYDPDDIWSLTYIHRPEEFAYSAIVKWVDDNNEDGVRPETVSLQLYANGESVPGTLHTVSENENWTTGWEGLKRYEGGEKIRYARRHLSPHTD